MQFLGKELCGIVRNASEEIILVAPFIKKNALISVLENNKSKDIKLTVVTRWHPSDILSGVCDIEIFDVIKEIPNAKLFIHPALHAKYYRVDDCCLIGSANLTQKALGWCKSPNLEILLNYPYDENYLKPFERKLRQISILVNEDIKQEIKEAVESLRNEVKNAKQPFLNSLVIDEVKSRSIPWLPLCRKPEDLFKIYLNKNVENMVKWTLDSGKTDIEYLSIPKSLSQKTFYKYAAAMLQQSEIVAIIEDKFANNVITPETGKKIIEENIPETSLVYTPIEHWETLKLWILFFLPSVYRQPESTNDLKKGSVIGEYKI